MEPRPHERGNACLVAVLAAAISASMEPRPHERGNTVPNGVSQRAFPRFNGATSSRTWKRARLPCPRAQRRRFNGATSSRTWKRLCAAFGKPDLLHASMEPRPHERGNCHQAILLSQWNGCFNGATSSRTWKLLGEQSGLIEMRLLQWSHVLTNVETAKKPAAKKSDNLLQWSHVLTNVETGNGSRQKGGQSICFNGATSSRTWKPAGAITLPRIEQSRFNGATSSRTWKLASWPKIAFP